MLFLTRIAEPLQGPRELAKLLAVSIAAASALTVVTVTVRRRCRAEAPCHGCAGAAPLQPLESRPAPPCRPPPAPQFAYYASLGGDDGSADARTGGGTLFRPLGGFEAGIAALLVALKQLIPDNEVALLGGALRFRAKVHRRGGGGCAGRLARRLRGGHGRVATEWAAACSLQLAAPQRRCRPPPPQHLPSLYVAAAWGGALVLGCAIRVAPFAVGGSLAAWAYLRFLQSHDGVR